MPSNYAHYAFGKAVYEKLNSHQKNIIERNQSLFYLGLHGPDIFFYYRPFFKNNVSRTGHDMHDESGDVFFQKTKKILKFSYSREMREAQMAYIYGCLCHFALDAACHRYIDIKEAASGISHTEIEMEFDRMLMTFDKENPLKFRQTDHLKPSIASAEVIHSLVSDISSFCIRKSIKDMIFYRNFITTESRMKRSLIYGLLRLTGKYDELKGMIISIEANPQCSDSNQKIYNIFKNTEKKAADMVENYDRFLMGLCPLSEDFCYTYGGRKEKKLTRSAMTERWQLEYEK